MKISSEESFRRSWNPQSLHQIQQTRRCTSYLPHRAQPIDTHTTIDTTLPDTGSHPPRASHPDFQLRAKRHKRNGETTSPFEDNHPFEDNRNFSKNSSATPAGGVNNSDYLARPLRVPQYPLPVGGRLKTFIQNWRQITTDKFVLRTIHQGYTIQVDPVYRKSLFWLRQITPLPENNAHSRALLKEVQTLEQKKAIRPINSRNGLILSPVFLVTKKSGKYRMILNLKRLNHFVPNQQFKMESLSKILPLIQCNEWAATIDLSDAYLHVPVAPWSQNLLGFAIGERTYVYQALPFGLRSSPRTFTLIVRAVAAALRERGIKIFCYLDDWQILGLSQQSLNRQVQTTIDLVTSLGFIINREKSKLTPTRNPEFSGGIHRYPKSKSNANTSQNPKGARDGFQPTPCPKVLGQILAGLLGFTGKPSGCGTSMQTAHENSPNPPTKIPMPNVTGKQDNGSQQFQDSSSNSVVAASPQSNSRETFSSPPSNPHDPNGCIETRLGSSARSRPNRGGMEPSGKKLAHQQIGNGSCPTGPPTFSDRDRGEVNPHKVRQQD